MNFTCQMCKRTLTAEEAEDIQLSILMGGQNQASGGGFGGFHQQKQNQEYVEMNYFKGFEKNYPARSTTAMPMLRTLEDRSYKSFCGQMPAETIVEVVGEGFIRRKDGTRRDYLCILPERSGDRSGQVRWMPKEDWVKLTKDQAEKIKSEALQKEKGPKVKDVPVAECKQQEAQPETDKKEELRKKRDAFLARMMPAKPQPEPTSGNCTNGLSTAVEETEVNSADAQLAAEPEVNDFSQSDGGCDDQGVRQSKIQMHLCSTTGQTAGPPKKIKMTTAHGETRTWSTETFTVQGIQNRAHRPRRPKINLIPPRMRKLSR